MKHKFFFEKGDKTFSQKDIKLSYLKPNFEIYYVCLESSITASSIQAQNMTGEVQEDWGDENNYSSDIEFTN